MNPNWIRTTIASILLAIVLKAGLHVPFLTTFVAICVIYLTHVVLTEMGAGATRVWSWVKFSTNMALGIVIFLALRYLVAGLIGLYPIDSYNEVNNAGGLFGILPSHDVSKVILWEVVFALVAGGLSVAWAQGKHRGLVGGIFGFSLLILTLQISLPGYAKTWPNREEVSTNMVRHGIVGTTALGAWRLAFGEPAEPPKSPTAPVVAKPVKTEEVLVLRFEGKTPCQTRINFPAQIWGDGPDFWAQFPGVKDPVLYSRGKFTAPDGVTSDADTVFFTNKPEERAVIRVYERTHRP